MKKLISGIKARLLNKLGENKYRALMQFVRFCLVGALNTLVDYGVFVLSYNVIFGRNDSLDFVAVGLGWCAGVVCSFICNSRWTFEQKKWSGKKVVLFLILNALLYGLTWLSLRLLGSAGIVEELAKLITLPFTTILNFLGNKLVIFRDAGKQASGRE